MLPSALVMNQYQKVGLSLKEKGAKPLKTPRYNIFLTKPSFSSKVFPSGVGVTSEDWIRIGAVSRFRVSQADAKKALSAEEAALPLALSLDFCMGLRSSLD